MTVVVTKIDDASLELLAALNALIPQLSTTAEPLTNDQLLQIVSSPATSLFVARDDDGICGCLTLVVFRIPSGSRAWIEDVIVDERTRGNGVGEALTTAAVEFARREGVRSVDLTSRPSRDAANRLYQRLGFIQRDTNVYRFFLEDS